MAEFTPVRLETLQEGIKDIMRGITPSYHPRSGQGWTYVNYSRPLEPAHRLYSIRWEGETLGQSVAVRNAVHDITLVIRAFYVCEEEELSFIVYSDKQDIVEALNRNLEPTTLGLLSVDIASDDPILDDTEPDDTYWVIEYEIPISYMKRNDYRVVSNS